MSITTKSAFADELGVTRARVSQYVKAGLPVRSDGQLNRDAALNWLKLNQPGLNYEDRGANRAARLAKPAEPRPAADRPSVEAATDPDGYTVAVELVAMSGTIAAQVAIEAGATMQIAYALDQAVTVHLWQAAEQILGIPPGRVSDSEAAIDERLQATETDWAALADEAGEPLDQDAWADFTDTLPSL